MNKNNETLDENAELIINLCLMIVILGIEDILLICEFCHEDALVILKNEHCLHM